MTPLSDAINGDSIYQPARRDELALRAYPGKWGGDDGVVSKSSPWKNKTDRWFRRFLRGDVAPTPIVQ